MYRRMALYTNNYVPNHSIDEMASSIREIYSKILPEYKIAEDDERGNDATDANSCSSNNENNAIDWTGTIFLREGWNNGTIVIESHKLLFFDT